MAPLRKAKRWVSAAVSLIAGFFVSLTGSAGNNPTAGGVANDSLKVDAPSLNQQMARTAQREGTTKQPPSPAVYDQTSKPADTIKKSPSPTTLLKVAKPADTVQAAPARTVQAAPAKEEGESEQVIFQNYVIQQLRQIDERLKGIEERLGNQK